LVGPSENNIGEVFQVTDPLTADMTPTKKDVLEAYSLIRTHVTQTPLLDRLSLNTPSGTKLSIKAESLQETGSFKFRGALHACMLAAKNGAEHVLAYSSGNHAQGIARAAKMLGLHATIIMPHDAPSIKMDRVRRDGAQIVTYVRGKESREELGEQLKDQKSAILIKPYDDARVIAGQGSLGLELLHQLDEPHDVVVCCGGGGLSSGIALAFDGSPHRLFVAEPKYFDDWGRSLEAGQRLSNERETGSICDAILTPTPGEITFGILKTRLAGHFAASDGEVLLAMKSAWEEAKITAEPGGAVALAAALHHYQGDRPVCAIVTGGNADPQIFARALAPEQQK